MAWAVTYQLRGTCIALEYFYLRCFWERGLLMKCLKMISISIILLGWHCQNDLFKLWTQHTALLIREVEEMPAATVAAREYYNENEIEADEETQGIVNHSQVEANVYKCLVSVLEIGLACSVDSQKERMKMEEVSEELHSIKKFFSRF